MQSKILVEAHFFPNLLYFDHLVRSKEVVLESQESFQKQTFRNRCEILTANGVRSLYLPICHGSGRDVIINTEISYKENWVPVFWKTIEAAYRKSPYFEFFEDVFKSILFEKEKSLFVLNKRIIEQCLQFFQQAKIVTDSSGYGDTVDEEIFDLRGVIHPKKVMVRDGEKRYPQNFGNKFAGNLSVIDLIMNEGPSGSIYLG